jgi:isopentenyl-diphosphate delta-isomerase
MEKMQAHREGVLHRAFSVFLVNDDGHFLLQKRSPNKYHSANLWSNACCSHPFPGEHTVEAAKRRLAEELGVEAKLEHLYHFGYRAEFANGLIEHELDHVFVGRFNGTPKPDPNEVTDWRYVSPEFLIKDVKDNPDAYTEWFKLSYEIVLVHTAIID